MHRGGAIRRYDLPEVGFTNREGQTLAQNAALATCDSVNRDGISTALHEESTSVKARSLPGYRPDRVIAVQVTDSAWSVLVSEDGWMRLRRHLHESGLLNAGED